ncbi:hypothetical protein HG536_0C06240 [Torulaspora globosa]|uniref:Transmembrane protein n=1 Tax=Torulaspora globosa TaxID=48254 RepID=A0A7G3ZG19_9SACH|nr:uncharacterized protein HG536_0C06240 [Torulaspora globosa]QLL32455.1 hypothetical protein HG536_0C06240 [Torulaspora globosa]
MARMTAPYSLFFAGTSIALLKLVQKLVERNGADEWLEPSESEYSTYVIEAPKIVHGDLSVPDTQELTWGQVFEFLAREVERVDLRIWFAVLLFCTLGPLAWSLSTGRSPSEQPPLAPSTCVSTQTEPEPEVERKDPAPMRCYHYEPGERALLQFGRSKSDSVLFNYVPLEFHEPELDEFEEVVGRCTLRQERANEVTPKEEPTAVPSVRLAQLVSEALADNGTETDASMVEDDSANRTTLGDTLGSLPNLRDSSLEIAGRAQSPTALQIQLSPRKTSIVDVQVNPEQAYSQPFSY